VRRWSSKRRSGRTSWHGRGASRPYLILIEPIRLTGGRNPQSSVATGRCRFSEQLATGHDARPLVIAIYSANAGSRVLRISATFLRVATCDASSDERRQSVRFLTVSEGRANRPAGAV